MFSAVHELSQRQHTTTIVSLDEEIYHITKVSSCSDFDTSCTQSNQFAKVLYFAEEALSLSAAKRYLAEHIDVTSARRTNL